MLVQPNLAGIIPGWELSSTTCRGNLQEQKLWLMLSLWQRVSGTASLILITVSSYEISPIRELKPCGKARDLGNLRLGRGFRLLMSCISCRHIQLHWATILQAAVQDAEGKKMTRRMW